MALNFPSSPAVGQVFSDGVHTWRFNGTSWEALGSAAAVGATGPSGPPGPSGPQGPQGVPGSGGGGGGDGRERLGADRIYYVSNAGLDTNDGLFAISPFKTVQYAINTAVTVDLNNHRIEIRLANGTYPEELNLPDSIVGGPGFDLLTARDSITILGNDASPGSVIVGNPPSPFFGVAVWANGSGWAIGGVRLVTAPSGFMVYVAEGVNFTVTRNMEFASTGGAQTGIILVSDSVFNYNGNLLGIYGNNWARFVNNAGGTFIFHANDVTIHDTPNWSEAFIVATHSSSNLFSGPDFTGASTGRRYILKNQSTLITNDDGHGAGVNYPPGNIQGTLEGGSVYDNRGGGNERLREPRTYHVSPTGNDSNSGLTVAAAFLTIEHAIDVVSRLDLDHRYIVTVQLEPGTYTAVDDGSTTGFKLKDPLNAHGLGGFDGSTPISDLCVLRGNPANPESTILSSGVNGVTLYIIESTAWKVEGVRLTSPVFGAGLAVVSTYSRARFDTVDFHFATDFNFGLYCNNFSYATTGPWSEVTWCKISQEPGVTSIISFVLAFNNSYVNTSSDIQCQNVTLTPYLAFLIVDYKSAIWDYNNYYESENITGLKFDLYHESTLTLRRLISTPGTIEGEVDSTSSLNFNNMTIVHPGEAIPMIDTVGGELLGVYTSGQLLASRSNNKVITNKGATAIVQYNLPGWQDLDYFIGPEPGRPFGFRYIFVVHSAFGIRITSTAGMPMSINGIVGGKIESTTPGSSITLINISESEWYATDVLGTWTITEQILNTVLPALSHTTIADESGNVTCNTGTWATTPAQVYYQWLHNGAVVHIAFGHPIHPNQNELSIQQIFSPGDTVQCRVSMRDASGIGSVRALSNICTIT